MAATSQLESIFFAALEKQSPAERQAYLDEACAGDEELRRQVERLLAAHAGAGDFLAAPSVAPPTAAFDEPIAEGPGTVIGPYKLLEQIGEGGFGLVFVAEQQRPVRRQVGFKIIKPGMDTRQVIARFEAERQALALMDHPNIAKVFDAGATESGRPYFVMELVRGVPITQYCDEHQLTVRERLELFITLCRAIQHAHQKGIIHRDVKPTNVLVTLHDGRPVPKVIDFGVAKALSQQLTERTIYTQFAQMIGTPLYMSPEQAEMSSLDIDTRSDIYSLGVVLYELLTGTTPFERERLKQAAADEIRRIVREEEPLKPSAQLSHSGDRLATTAAQRHTEPARLTKLVRGELDWIVMKCLEKDRNRRYETANGLAQDMERYLQDEPVQACPPSFAYQFRKFARRNKVALLTAAIVTVTLIAATIVSVWQATVARRAEALAEERLAAETQARQEATAVSELLQEALQSANPANAKGPDYTVRQLLDDVARRLEERFQDQPAAEAAIRETIARSYGALELLDEAGPHFERALELKERLYGPVHADVARLLFAQGWNVLGQRDPNRAEAHARRALAIHRQLGLRNSETAGILGLLQTMYTGQTRHAAAEEVGKEALLILREQPVLSSQLATTLYQVAGSLLHQGRYAEAEQLAREAVSLHRKLQGDKHPQTAWALSTLGRSLVAQQKYDEAEKAWGESVDIWAKNHGYATFGWSRAVDGLMQVLRAKGDDAGLKALGKDVVTIAKQTLQRHPENQQLLLQALPRLAAVREVGDVEADEVLSGICKRLKNLPPIMYHITADDLNNTAWSLVKYPVSDPTVVQCAVRLAEELVANNPHDAEYLVTLGAVLYRAARYEEAAQRLEESIARYASDDSGTSSPIYAQLFLAMTRWQQGERQQARQLLAEVQPAIDEAIDSPSTPWNDRATLEVLRREADALIGENGTMHADEQKEEEPGN